MSRSWEMSFPATGVYLDKHDIRSVLRTLRVIVSFLVLFVSVSTPAFASVTATIEGAVTDSTGAVVPNALITVTNNATGVSQTATTNDDGYYTLSAMQPGTYDLTATKSGFETFIQKSIVLNVNDVRNVPIVLRVGHVTQAVTVTAQQLQVDTTSTQMGEVIGAPQIVGVPLNGRSFTDLLALQPGVANTTSLMVGNTSVNFNFQTAGFAMPNVSGSENPGNQSVNGMRETANGFLLNGLSVEEWGYNGAAVIPNLDTLAEFRILTNNFNSEYGDFAGGQINVVTKSGTNSIHGDLFEFLRNTDVDAANYFDRGIRGAFQQSQFGGTAGGSIIKNKLFYFAGYQGTKNVVGQSTGLIAVPTAAEESGNFLAEASSFAGHTVVGSAWADTLSNELGYPVTAGEPYYTPGCTSSTDCVFPNAQIPSRAISPISSNILAAGAIPTANSSGYFSTSAYPERLTDNKISGRVDATTRLGQLFGYYDFDQYSLLNPYPTATVPGFPANTTARTQFVDIGDTKTLGSNAVNDARVGYLRVKEFINTPSAGNPHEISSLGFAGGQTPGAFTPLQPAIETIPEMDFENFVIGGVSRTIGIAENTFQAADNYSHLLGRHSIVVGGAFHFTELTEANSNVPNGYFFFNQQLETGIDFADFLVGAPGAFEQGQALPAATRSAYLGLFAQDAWHVTQNLALNYGVRWDVITPWWEKHNELEVLKLGEQSVKFPNSPTGWVFPGDPGIPRTIAPVRYNNFAPRLGLAYSPSANTGFAHRLFGGPGRTAFHVGYGLFYTTFEGGYDYSMIGDAPYGYFDEMNGTSFANPYQTRATGTINPNPFPYTFPPTNVSKENPDPNVPASAFGVIGTSPAFNPNNRVPYAEQYELSIQRQLSGNDMLTIAYVGTQAHRLLVTVEANPVNQSACLALYLQNPSSPSCGPNNEPTSLRGPFGANFGSEGIFSTVGPSSYNSMQVNYRHTSSSLQLLLGYTFSKAMDDSSSFGLQVNPFNPALTRGLSSFNVPQNFVASYVYNLPFSRLGGPKRLTGGWALSGITTFAKGLPVFIFENDDQSLLGTDNSGPMPLGIDTPNFSGGSVRTENPRKNGLYYFDTSKFTQEPIGQLGTSRRSFFNGPGENNFNMALLKDTQLSERYRLQFRAEFFNVFNHTQFSTVSGNFNSPTFGQAIAASSPRIGQFSLKMMF